MSRRIAEAKARLREAADAAEPERHLPALARKTPLTMVAVGVFVGVFVGVTVAASPPVRRRLVELVLRSRDRDLP